MGRRGVALAISCVALCAGTMVTGCSNVGSSQGPNSRCGNSNYTPAGQISPDTKPTAGCLPPK